MANRLGISDAVSNIATELRHWHAWSKKDDDEDNDDFSSSLVKGLTYIRGSQTRLEQAETTVNEFVFDGSQYRLSVSNERYWDGDKFAELGLERLVDGSYGAVFGADISQNIEREFSPWRVSQVTRLELGGMDQGHRRTSRIA